VELTGIPALGASLGLVLVGGMLGVGLLRLGARRFLAGPFFLVFIGSLGVLSSLIGLLRR
jgi:hypothetical protein